MNSEPSDKVHILMTEYTALSSARETFIANYTNTNFYFGLLIGLLTLPHLNPDFRFAYLLVPYIIIIQNTIVLFNQYHQFMVEEYLCDLEERLGKLHPEIVLYYYRFYSEMFGRNIFTNRGRTFVKPTAVLAVGLGIVNVAIFIFAIAMSWNLFQSYEFLRVLHVAASSAIFLLIGASYAFMPKLIRPMFRTHMEEMLKKIKGVVPK